MTHPLLGKPIRDGYSTSSAGDGIEFSYWSEEDYLTSRRGLPKDGDPTHLHGLYLPRGVVFTKVRIRSDKPVKTGKISWVRFSVICCH